MRIQVLCPNPACKAILGFDVESPIKPDVVIMCPKCKQKYYYKDYLPMKMSAPLNQPPIPEKKGDETQYASSKMGTVSGNSDETHTQMGTLNMIIGSLQQVGFNEIYPLKRGHNVIGRQASSSTATIQIPDQQNARTMSRAHLDVDVVVQPTCVKHMVYLSPGGQKNPTYINGVELQPESKLFLNDGDKITIGKQTLLFRIIDDDKTKL